MTADIRTLLHHGQEVRQASELVLQAYRAQGDGPSEDSDPELLAEGLDEFLDVLAGFQTNSGTDTVEAAGSDIGEIADYGLQLLGAMIGWAEALEVREAKPVLEQFTLAVARWIRSRGAQVSHLEPVVDILADRANTTGDLDELAQIADLMGEMIQAASPAIRSDDDQTDPARPWRVLNINRGIAATRAHDPDRMEAAFDQLVANLPEEAAGFFEEGMQQMEAVGYPFEIRSVMERYHRRYTQGAGLH